MVLVLTHNIALVQPHIWLNFAKQSCLVGNAGNNIKPLMAKFQKS